MANGICDKYCKGCIYSQVAVGEMLMCCYYLITNIRRPCPAGKGCTVKQTGRKKGRWAYENNATWKKKKVTKKKSVLHKVCPCCGTEFETNNPRQIYCSYQCKNKVAQAEWHKHHTEKEKKVIVCAVCGKKFTHTDGRRKCCSPECAAISRKLTYKRYDMKRGKRHEETESASGTV